MIPDLNFQAETVLTQLPATRVDAFQCRQEEPGFWVSGMTHSLGKLTYVQQGTLHAVADGRDLLLNQGDLVIYGPGQWHMHYADVGMAPRMVTVFFEMGSMDLAPLANRRFTVSQSQMPVLQGMLREQGQADEFSGAVVLAQLNVLLLLLLREAGELRPARGIHPENRIICRAQQFIASHVRQKLSVPVVARQVDVSPSYLTALFHKHLNISPGEYIRRVKLQESKQMIRQKELNFTEISAQLQYSTVHHFSRQFKEKFGITPTEYAKNVK